MVEWVLERGLGRAAEASLKPVGWGVKGFGF